MKYFSMFSGIGGFELGIQSAIETAECVGYSEIDRYAIKVYERQFNGHKNYGNATTIDPVRLPDFDLLVGGFPCQAFSIAGKRAGFNDTRGTLFFDVARILKDKRPRHLVLENVKGLLSHDSGKTFTTILGVLADLGYRVEWQILNSKHHGVPQNRERVYIVGHLGDGCGREVLPIRENGEVSAERQGQISPTITSRYYKQGQSDPYIFNDSTPSIRKLTPIECERLQGFPDNWTKYGIEKKLATYTLIAPQSSGFNATESSSEDVPALTESIIPISDTQRYKMCGNAVTVNVVEAVVSNMIDCLTPAEVYA